jgi:hypothetical protein
MPQSKVLYLPFMLFPETEQPTPLAAAAAAATAAAAAAAADALLSLRLLAWLETLGYTCVAWLAPVSLSGH